MKRYYLYFVFTLTTVAFITQGAAQVPTDETTESLPLTDYFDQVTLFSDAGGQGNNTPQSSDRAVGFTVEVILVLEGDGTTSELTQEEMRTEPSILRKRGNSA